MATLRYRALAESPAVRDTLRALGTLAGMAVKLAPFDPHSGLRVLTTGTVPLCRLILDNPNGEAACRRFVAQLQGKCGVKRVARFSAKAKRQPLRAFRTPHSVFRTQTCFAGLTELAAPIIAQGRLVGVLICGEVFQRRPTEQGFRRLLRRLRALGIRLDPELARAAYSRTPVAGPPRVRAARQLLGDLAEHLGEMASHCLLARQPADRPCVTCARKLVTKHLGEMPTSRSAAREAHVTEPYFCRAFKAATGMTFSEYVARCHVDRARELLHDLNLRVTEVAFAAGFQSIPHFNHTFKRYTGLSPNRYRASLGKA
jgi:AraC-like DNA-binding protein